MIHNQNTDETTRQWDLPNLSDSRVFFDIETVKSQDQDDRKYFFEHAKPPATIKDPAKRMDWYGSDKHDAAVDKDMDNTVFDGLFGEAVSIAWGHFDKSHAWHEYSATREGDDDDEYKLLGSFFGFLTDYRPHTPILCGYNIIGFDIKFLQKRALVLGMKLPRQPIWPLDLKPWSKNVEDLMLKVEDDRTKFVSMDKACYALGIEGKDGVDGSMVGALWEDGQYPIIDEYCLDDVRRNRNIWVRLAETGLIR